MKILAVAVLVSLTLFVAPAESAVPTAHPRAAGRTPNRRAAMVAGWALHFAQDVRALQRTALRRREKSYGPSDPQVRADRHRLRVIGQKVRFFSRVKQVGEKGHAKNRRHSR